MKYLLILTIFLSLLEAAPARGGERVFEQKNGVTFTGQARGNERLNWIESSDGEILKYNPATKNYELAEIKDNQLKASGIKYEDGIKKAKSLKNKKIKNEDLYNLWNQKEKIHRLKMTTPRGQKN